jgi:hypothetical protein
MGSRLSKSTGVCGVHEVNIVFSYLYHSAHFAELAVGTGVQGLLRFTLAYSNDRRSDTVMMSQTYADTPVTPLLCQDELAWIACPVSRKGQQIQPVQLDYKVSHKCLRGYLRTCIEVTQLR